MGKKRFLGIEIYLCFSGIAGREILRMSTNGSRVSFRADDQVLELVGVDGCTALRPHENLLNCTL